MPALPISVLSRQDPRFSVPSILLLNSIWYSYVNKVSIEKHLTKFKFSTQAEYSKHCTPQSYSFSATVPNTVNANTVITIEDYSVSALSAGNNIGRKFPLR